MNARDDVMPLLPDLARLRQAAFDQLASETGHGLSTWRVIITDSESPTGVALTCTSGSDLHVLPYYPGGPIRDEDGVYDCCPDTQFETYSTSLAAYLVALLNSDARIAECRLDIETALGTYPCRSPAGHDGDCDELTDEPTGKASATAPSVTPLVIFRASYEPDVIGLYTTEAVAREHCVAALSHEHPASVTVVFDWIGDESEPLDPWDLVVQVDGGDRQPSGYRVTPIEVAAAYDPEDDR